MEETIKAHITKEQREILLLLVNRRLEDVRTLILRGSKVLANNNESSNLLAVKYELEQAGS